MKNTNSPKHSNSTLFVVATPIGNLGDISFRAVDILQKVDYIVCEDTRTILPLLQRYNIDSKKTLSCHKFNEYSVVDSIIEKIVEQGCNVALTSDAGTPCISDPGAILVERARQQGVRVVTIPGACALVSAIAISGFQGDWAFLGFIPRDNKGFKQFIVKMQLTKVENFVLYESPHRILVSLTNINKHFPNATYMVAKEMTKIFEYSIKGSYQKVLDNLTSDTIVEKGEYVVVVQPNHIETKTEQVWSLEAMLVQHMVKGNTLKDSISMLSKSTDYAKKDLYQASLNLKELF
ncbi:MAG: 16S rRNA (cytidine(1402)-2'-O)-methyltransferase [Firmicutes bacterium]|nr:16S rRNA (cytidine(1402)-2'-O)-methyltransferase [Bacillota bacterium]MCL1954132.1 16S rRNA (cytidine(1402)-2'-O)-methyltransferase [Bacillota bacterium]